MEHRVVKKTWSYPRHEIILALMRTRLGREKIHRCLANILEENQYKFDHQLWTEYGGRVNEDYSMTSTVFGLSVWVKLAIIY